jgi:DtxR family Mn-dependent transcriptional regulator
MSKRYPPPIVFDLIAALLDRLSHQLGVLVRQFAAKCSSFRPGTPRDAEPAKARAVASPPAWNQIPGPSYGRKGHLGRLRTAHGVSDHTVSVVGLPWFAAKFPLLKILEWLSLFLGVPKYAVMENRSTEDYIKKIYFLGTNGKAATTTEIARHLKIGNGSVTDMLKKLAAKRLIEYEPYHGVSLTRTGKQLALRIVRRHRLWEMFLARFLGYSWEEIHEEAERLEHVTSDELERRLDRVLNYPKVDPHGHPIPDAKGCMVENAGRALAEFNPGDSVRIVSVSDSDSDFLRHAAEIGLRLDTALTVLKKTAFDGSMVLKVGRKERVVSSRFAGNIFVRPMAGKNAR